MEKQQTSPNFSQYKMDMDWTTFLKNPIQKVGRPWKSKLFHLNKPLIEVVFGEPMETLEMERFLVPEIMWKMPEFRKHGAGFPILHWDLPARGG